jgi:molybdate/tungstate transport system ATP-binding protein
MLSVERISKAYPGFEIKDISFEVRPNQYFVLLGRTGAGKSLLLETIAGLIRPDSGRIALDEEEITHEKIQNRRISLVFQNRALFPHMSVYDNIAYPLRARGRTKSQIRERIAALGEDFGIKDLLSAKPQTLSGGESQRVSLARAVASEPRCLLLDEPLSALDTAWRSDIRTLLRKISAGGRLIVHVTHDYTEAVSLATHIAVMEDGGIAQIGTVEEIFQHPKSEFIARFIGVRNFFDGYLEDVEGPGTSLRRFTTGGLSLAVLSDDPSGPGYIMVRSEDVTIYNTTQLMSARNNFEGPIVDITPARGGVEVLVNIGRGKTLEVAALITNESAGALELRPGKKVWVSFKASAARYIQK